MFGRKESDPFYHSRAWKAARELVLIRDHWLCQECKRAFEAGEAQRIRQATTVHHIKPREERPDLALDLDNLESICAICHNQQHPEKGRRPGKTTEAPPAGTRVIKI